MSLNISIFTIGYGSRSYQEFSSLLKGYNIEFLVDIRSHPFSKYKPEFTQNALNEKLRLDGIRYIWLGKELGGRPDNKSCYTNEGKVDYSICKTTPEFQAGIARLRKAWSQQLTIALMCSEGKPQDCHRSKLVGEALVSEQIEVSHIDEKGIIKTQDDIHDVLLTHEEKKLLHEQQALFPEAASQGFTSRKKYR